MNLFTELKPDWHSTLPERLLDAPTTVFKAVDDVRADALREVLNAGTVRAMATQPMVDWVWRAFRLFRAGVQRDLPEDAAAHVSAEWRGRSCGDWLASPLSSLSELSAEDALRLGDALGWFTVRHMATDRAFDTAREVMRIVTGQPVPPEDTVTRPLPEYFKGGTQRFHNRQREPAGLPQRPPPPPPPAAPARGAPPPAVRPAPELPTEGELAPAVAASLRPGGGEAWPPGPRRHHKDYTPDGTYIPKGGGSRGWLGNSGVAKAERANRYRYEETVNVERFRRASLEDAVRVNNRGAERKALRMQVRWGLADAKPAPGLCLDVSITGAKIRVGQQLKQGTPIGVTWVHRDDLTGLEQALLSLPAHVVWSQTVDRTFRTPRYDCGLEFEPLELAAQERLTLLLTDRIDQLLDTGGEPQQFGTSG